MHRPLAHSRIGAIESSATTRLPNLLAKYHQRFPEVSIQIITGTWKQLLVDISQHKLDGAIVAGNIEFPMLNKLGIYQEDMVLIASHSLGEIHCQEDLIGKEILCGRKAVLTVQPLKNGLNLRISLFLLPALLAMPRLLAVSVQAQGWR